MPRKAAAVRGATAGGGQPVGLVAVAVAEGLQYRHVQREELGTARRAVLQVLQVDQRLDIGASEGLPQRLRIAVVEPHRQRRLAVPLATPQQFVDGAGLGVGDGAARDQEGDARGVAGPARGAPGQVVGEAGERRRCVGMIEAGLRQGAAPATRRRAGRHASVGPPRTAGAGWLRRRSRSSRPGARPAPPAGCRNPADHRRRGSRVASRLASARPAPARPGRDRSAAVCRGSAGRRRPASRRAAPRRCRGAGRATRHRPRAPNRLGAGACREDEIAAEQTHLGRLRPGTETGQQRAAEE